MRKTGYRLYRNDKKMAKKHDLMEQKNMPQAKTTFLK
jgi:hypothetical protein